MSDDNNTISFATELAEYKDTNQGKAALAKLHGSIDKENIVAPTWNKGGVNSKVLSAWKLAHDVLIEANHLRILGYSLPEGDAYIRYLLKSAAIKSPHLKSIDVICLESTDSVRKRYEEFIRFKYFRFMNANIIEYLRKNRDLGRAGRRETSPGSGSISLNKLEDSHNSFMVNE